MVISSPRSAGSSLLRASVTAAAGGTNLCSNPGPAQNVALYGGVGATPPLITWTPIQPAASPVGEPGCGLVTWQGADPTAGLTIPNYGIAGDGSSQVTVSAWCYVPTGSPTCHLEAADSDGSNATAGPSTGVVGLDTWVRISLTWTPSAGQTAPVITLVPDSAPADLDPTNPQLCYWAGVLIQPGSVMGAYTAGGGQPGDPVQVLVDGSDTPITANGLSDYIPTPGDRLLVQRVGGVVEVVQYLSRGTVPYLQGQDITDLAAQVDSNSQALADTQDLLSATSDNLTTAITDTNAALDSTNTALSQYQATNDATISGLQGAYDVLSGLGTAGVEEDYFWVGDDPAQSTLKLVQISTFVQSALWAPDATTLVNVLGILAADDVGDLTFADPDVSPPMTTFYSYFTANGLLAMAWNA